MPDTQEGSPGAPSHLAVSKQSAHRSEVGVAPAGGKAVATGLDVGHILAARIDGVVTLRDQGSGAWAGPDVHCVGALLVF